MISILTITVHTNIPGSKIILYNPSMTMQQESPDSTIFSFNAAAATRLTRWLSSQSSSMIFA